MYRDDREALLARIEALESNKRQLQEDQRRIEAENARLRAAAPAPATRPSRMMSPTSFDQTWIACAQDLEKHLKEAHRAQKAMRLWFVVGMVGMWLLQHLHL